jgi:DNA-binding protein H-NS
VKPKYRNPATGEVWSGRGRMAGWLAAKVKAGEKAQRYLVK